MSCNFITLISSPCFLEIHSPRCDIFKVWGLLRSFKVFFLSILPKQGIAMSNAIATTNHCLKLTILQAILQVAMNGAASHLGSSPQNSAPKAAGSALLRELRGEFRAWIRPGWLSFPLGPMPSPAHTPPLSTPMKIKADKQPMQDKFPLFPNHKPNPEALDSWSGQSL